MAAGPHGKRSPAVIADLTRIDGLDDDTHAFHQFRENASGADAGG